jgi:hypothetical protein
VSRPDPSAAFYDLLRLLMPELPDPKHVAAVSIDLEPGLYPEVRVIQRIPVVADAEAIVAERRTEWQAVPR